MIVHVAICWTLSVKPINIYRDEIDFDIFGLSWNINVIFVINKYYGGK
jgi:hypothetical protein